MARLYGDVAYVVRGVVQQRALGKRDAVKNDQTECRTRGELQQEAVRPAVYTGQAGGSCGCSVHEEFQLMSAIYRL